MVTEQAPVTLKLRNTLGKNTNNPRWYTHISQLTQFMPPPETSSLKVKSGVSLRCARSIPGTYVSLLAPGKTDYAACHPRKTTKYILHVVSITTHTHDRRKSIGKKKKKKIRRERKGKKREESEKRKRKRKRKKREDKKSKKRQDKKSKVQEGVRWGDKCYAFLDVNVRMGLHIN